MPKHNKETKYGSEIIKYGVIIMFVLTLFAYAFIVLKPTYMRYRFEVTANVIGYAKETRNSSYIVTFDSNGGIGSMSDQPIQFGVLTALKPNEFTRTDYNFYAWNTEPDGSGTSYYDEDEITNTTLSTITLYAQWTQGVAELNGQIYNTLQAAINAATGSTQKTIRLLQDVSENIEIPTGRNIIINLQNNTVRDPGSKAVVTNKGNLTLKKGTISSSNTTDGAINNENGGTLIFENITAEMTNSSGKQALYNKNGGTVYIKGSSSHFSSASTIRAAVHNVSGGIMYVEEGTIISTSNNQPGLKNEGTLTIGVKKDGNVSITSPLIVGHTYGLETSSGSTAFNFYDGIIKGITEWTNDKNKKGELEPGYKIKEEQETIGTDTYKTACLERAIIVTFNGNANDATVDETERTIESSGQAVGALPTATRPNYSLDGWFTDPDNGTQISASTIITGDVTFFAHWTQQEAEVTFNANGGTVDGTNENVTIGVNIGSSIGSANLPTPTKHYKSFVGWYTDPNPSSGTLIDGTETILQNVTYYAHWTAINVTVNFDPTSGTIPQADASKTVEAGEPVGALPTTATSANQYFAGWYTDPTNGTRIDESELIGDTTVTFYAHWISSSVARIGAIHYETLQDAIDDVPTNNTQKTITLITNDLEAVSILADKNIILDLDGHTLYNNGSKTAPGMDNGQSRPSVIENSGTLKITNGTITTNSSQAAINTGTGSVIIEDATITHTGTSSKNVKQAIYVYSGTLLITGNSVISANNSGSYGGYDRGTIQIAEGLARITEGTVTSTAGPAIVNQASGTLILGEKDGTVDNTTPVIQGNNNGIKTSSGTFKFYDGIIKGKTNPPINGTIADYEDDTQIANGTETIGGATYYTEYLESTQ